MPQERLRFSDRALPILARFARMVRVIEDVTVSILIVAITAMIFAGVIARYVFDEPLQWSDELSLALFVWLTFVGAAIAWRSHDLFGIDLLVDRLPRRLRQAVWFANYGVIAFVCLAGIWWGAELAISNLTSFTLNLQLPRFYIDIALPVGSVLMLWHTAEHMARVVRGETPVDDRYLETATSQSMAPRPPL